MTQPFGVSMPWLCVAMSLMVAGCAAPPPPPKVNTSYIVLLEDEDGKTGQVRFTSDKGETVLDRALQAALLAGPAKATFEVSKAKLDTDFAAALAAAPAKAQVFLLYFQAGGARLTAESEALLPQILQSIASRPAADMSIIGHTDTAGDADINLRLGMERAQTVARLLAGVQLDQSRIVVESHGEKNLLINTGDNVGEPRNRRVEVTVR